MYGFARFQLLLLLTVQMYDLMDMTEEMVAGLAIKVAGSSQTPFETQVSSIPREIEGLLSDLAW